MVALLKWYCKSWVECDQLEGCVELLPLWRQLLLSLPSVKVARVGGELDLMIRECKVRNQNVGQHKMMVSDTSNIFKYSLCFVLGRYDIIDHYTMFETHI